MRTRNVLRSCSHGLLGRASVFLLGALFSAGLAFTITTYAVHDLEVFELDNGSTGANAIDEPVGAVPPSGADDWARNNFPNLGQCLDINGIPLDPQPNSCGYVAGPNVDPANPGGSAFRSLFIQDADGVGNDDDVFTGGGSKDDLDVSQWLWTTSSTPDKDDLLPVGAAAYLQDLTDDAVDNKELLIYLFGSLFAPNGSAAIGAWLFKKDIGLCADGSFGVVDDSEVPQCIADQPDDLHTVGDVFVVAETASGGREVQMQVFKWVGSDAAAQAACVTDGGVLESPKNSLCKVLDEENALCTNGLTDDDACGSMNLGTVKSGQTTMPGSPTESPDDWGFQSKFPPTDGPASPPGTDGIGNDDFPETSLFEAGFNFTNLFGDEIGCFNSFLMNTRSSHEVRAQLKDLALGAFPLCGIKVEKTGDTLGKVGDPVDYTITVTNTGAIPQNRVSIVDDVLGNLADPANPYVTSSTCGATLAAGASCVIEATRTVVVGDPDPLPNTVTVVYSAGGDESTDSASHEVNLFQPAVMVDKTGDTLSKVGDPVNYTFVVTNQSSDDSPDLINGTIVDSLLGNLLDPANPYVTGSTCSASLATDGSCTISATRTVQAGDPDPLPNTVTVHYNPDGFPNDITDSDDHSVNLFQPSVTIDKTGTELSKVTDDVDYVITVNNTSSDDSPDLVCDITDSLLGTLATGVNLVSGGEYVINASRTVVEGDPDPLVNTATVTCSPVGFPNELTDSDSHSTNLFQPSVNLVKTGDELSKATDDVTYTITLNNTSSVDSPDLECTITDAMLGINENVTVASGANHVINEVYTVLVGDPDPLLNTASASCSPIGFPNVLQASDGHSINLFQPSVTIDKTANCEAVAVGEDITYTYTITNTSSGDSPALNLVSIVDDKLGSLAADASGAGCDSLASGASCNFNKVVSTSGGLPGTLTNTVNVLYNPAGFPNEITASDSQDCEIVLPAPARVVVEKVLLNSEGLAFDYDLVNMSEASLQLTPLFGQLPLNSPPFVSPFLAAGAGNGFDTSLAGELTVDITDITQTEQASVTELFPLPPFVSFVSLNCEVTLDPDANSSVVIAGATADLTLGSGDIAFCRYVNEFNPGDEGCTPGYWKQPQHFGSWTNPPYDPFTTQLQDVFNFTGVNGQIGGLADDLMLDALSYQGGTGKLGAAQILLRAAVAAVLNASHNGVQFAFTEAQVIALVDAQLQGGSRDTMLALATDLDQANNGVFNDNGGTESCPLGLNPLP